MTLAEQYEKETGRGIATNEDYPHYVQWLESKLAQKPEVSEGLKKSALSWDWVTRLSEKDRENRSSVSYHAFIAGAEWAFNVRENQTEVRKSFDRGYDIGLENGWSYGYNEAAIDFGQTP